jgi:peptide/nickel transport system permease protein
VVQASLDIGSAILMAATWVYRPRRAAAHRRVGRDGGERPQLRSRSVVVLRLSGAAILITAVGFNLFGDGIQDLLDPKSGGRNA